MNLSTKVSEKRLFRDTSFVTSQNNFTFVLLLNKLRMKEKIKQLIAENTMRQGVLKLTLRNLEIMGINSGEKTRAILDTVQELEEMNQKLHEILRQIN